MANTSELLFGELKIRPVTRRMAISLLVDRPLASAAIVDFGLDTPNHVGVIKVMLLSGSASLEECLDNPMGYKALCERVKELDNAYGNGSLLNALVCKYAPEYAGIVRFHTSWDEIFGRIEEETPTKR